jgi:hypothetical protein
MRVNWSYDPCGRVALVLVVGVVVPWLGCITLYLVSVLARLYAGIPGM